VAKASDRSNAHLDPAGLQKWQPGAVMIALWVLGMALFVCVAVALHVVTLVLATSKGVGADH
jgi:hypothetical protein